MAVMAINDEYGLLMVFWSSFKSVSFRALFRPISPRLYPNLYSIWSVWCKNESILHAGVLQGPLVLSVLKQIYKL